MSILAKSKGEVTYKDLTGFHKWFLIVLISMGSSIIYTPMYLKGVFYDPLMTALGCTNADLGAMVSFYGIVALICYLPSGILAPRCSRSSTRCFLPCRCATCCSAAWALPPS